MTGLKMFQTVYKRYALWAYSPGMGNVLTSAGRMNWALSLVDHKIN